MADNKTLWTWGNQQKYHTEIIEELDKKFEENDLASVAISGSYNDLTDVPEIISTAVALLASEWVDNFQTVSVDSVTADNIVIVSPAPDSQDNYTQSKIRCVSQSDKELIFSCDTTPTSDINVNIVTL